MEWLLIFILIRGTSLKSYQPFFLTVQKLLKIFHLSALNAIAHYGGNNAPEKAKAVFEEALKNFEEQEEDSLLPITATLNGVLFAFAKSEDEKAGSLAEEFLVEVDGMQHDTKEKRIKPDTISYTTVSRLSLQHYYKI